MTPCGSRFLQEPHGVTFQKTAFFIVTAVKTPNLNRKGSFAFHQVGEPYPIKGFAFFIASFHRAEYMRCA
jgi:hypothetical protein